MNNLRLLALGTVLKAMVEHALFLQASMQLGTTVADLHTGEIEVLRKLVKERTHIQLDSG
jgi:hypothetical protein